MFAQLDFRKELFSQADQQIVDQEKNIMLRTFNDGHGFLLVERTPFATVFFSEHQTYFGLLRGGGKLVYNNALLIIHEHVNHFEIFRPTLYGCFEFIIQKNILKEDFFFEVGATKFILSDNQIKPV